MTSGVFIPFLLQISGSSNSMIKMKTSVGWIDEKDSHGMVDSEKEKGEDRAG